MLESDLEGNVSRWVRPRGQCQVIESDGELSYPAGTQLVAYDPKDALELPDHLAEVETGLTTPAEFVAEYGLLGYHHFHPAEGFPPEVEFGNPPAEFVLAIDPNFKKALSSPLPAYLKGPGEPVRWFQAHARTVRRALEIVACLRLKDENGLRMLLKDLPKATYAALGVPSSGGAFEWVPEYAELDLARAAKAALAGLINPNLRGLHRVLRSDTLGNLRYEFVFQSLVQVIYWHLAMRVEDEKAVAKFCKRCGEPFFHRDPRQKYCPKPLGKKRSVCGNREGIETYRARWRSAKGRSSKKRRKHGSLRKR